MNYIKRTSLEGFLKYNRQRLPSQYLGLPTEAGQCNRHHCNSRDYANDANVVDLINHQTIIFLWTQHDNTFILYLRKKFGSWCIFHTAGWNVNKQVPVFWLCNSKHVIKNNVHKAASLLHKDRLTARFSCCIAIKQCSTLAENLTKSFIRLVSVY